MKIDYQDLRTYLVRQEKRYDQRKSIMSVKHLIVHCSGNVNLTAQKCAQYHTTPSPNNHLSTKGAPAIAYHWWIDPEGKLYKCLDEKEISWHAKGWNEKSLGICLQYDGANERLPLAQENTLSYFLAMYSFAMDIKPENILGHRELEGTGFIWFLAQKHREKRLKKVCPGLKINLDNLREEVKMLRESLSSVKFTGGINNLFSIEGIRFNLS